VKKNPESVFNFVERLTVMSTEQKGFSKNIVTGNRLQRIFETYLEDERKAFKLLREAEKDFEHRFEREKKRGQNSGKRHHLRLRMQATLFPP